MTLISVFLPKFVVEVKSVGLPACILRYKSVPSSVRKIPIKGPKASIKRCHSFITGSLFIPVERNAEMFLPTAVRPPISEFVESWGFMLKELNFRSAS